MKIVFFGTPEYVMPVLKLLHKKFVTGPGKSPITAVVTQPPRPIGRKQILNYSAVDKWAHEHKIPCFYTASELLDANLDFELGVLASYGEIIRKEVINLFPQGILVIHPSLLPKYRGASPVSEAIKNGDRITGSTILKMDEKMDHGPIVAQFKEEILITDTTETLRNRLFEKSALVLAEALEPYIRGKIRLKLQDESAATYTKILTKNDGYIELSNPNLSPEQINNFVRAMSPWPGAWTFVSLSKNPTQKKRRLKILKTHLIEHSPKDIGLVIDQVQLEGKGPVSFKQFKEAYLDVFS